MSQPASLARSAAVGMIAVALVGCGSGGTTAKSASTAPKSCPATVMDALYRVVRRVYHEGVSSERTVVARQVIERSAALRQAVEGGSPRAVAAAAHTLVAGGRMTNLVIEREGHTLADVGGPAIAPISGTLLDASGKPLATYTTSVWSQSGFLAESQAISESAIALRVAGRTVAGSAKLPPGRLPPTGSTRLGGVEDQFSSFGGKVFPKGPMRVYLVRSPATITPLCGSTETQTAVNTLSHIATLIYDGEAGRRTLPQIRRVQRNAALLAAVARRDPLATRMAVEKLLNQHIVRLRVSAGGRLLADVGGPYVLAPVGAPLRLGGKGIGNFVLSIQDDEGYLRLARRLAGLHVLMYMNTPHPTLVKNSLGPNPGNVPDEGPYTYRGQSFEVFTVHAKAFPSGPLTIHVLIPIPYR